MSHIESSTVLVAISAVSEDASTISETVLESEELTYYTYQITATDSAKYYYGVSHVKAPNASEAECLTDGYWGSGGRKFSNWRLRHRRSLVKEVVSIHISKLEAYAMERDLVSELWKTDPLCLNSAPGGSTVAPHRGEFSKVEELCCKVHGWTKHRDGHCARCVAQSSISIGSCEIHGESTFQGEFCSSCTNESLISERDCAIHGISKHRGDSCCKCTFAAREMRVCEVHGSSPHWGDYCCQCSEQVGVRACATHGEVKHIGDQCYSCTAESSVSTKVCRTHGEAKHLGDSCYQCKKSGYSLAICETHGESKFRGGKCSKCAHTDRLLASVECSLCGKEFAPANNRQKICPVEHYVDCGHCGESMLYGRRKSYCSISCGVRASNAKRADAKSLQSAASRVAELLKV